MNNTDEPAACGRLSSRLVNTRKNGTSKVVIMKELHKGTIPFNYPLITCLLIMRKVLSGIIAIKLHDNMSQYICEDRHWTRYLKHQLFSR